MTLVVKREVDGPAVHVLAIGVGAYRHLPGGAEPVSHDTLGLRQLSGPPRAAAHFVDWVVGRMRHPTARLATVEMLVSPAQSYTAPEPGGQPVDLELPSMANVAAAFERWYASCNSSSDNVAIFWFCGHGVERESQFLLLEDFGRSELSLLENAIDIAVTYLGMARCKATTQYFFIDACREIPFQLLQLLSGNARVLVTPQLVGDNRRDTALLFATSGGAKAYGRTDQPTRFTDALVRAMDGLGSRPDGNRWVVDFATLQRAVTVLLRVGEEGAPPQQPTLRGAGTGELHLCSGPPIVPLAIACEPVAAIPGARVTLEPLAATPGSPASAPLVGAQGWQFEVPADFYLFTVDFPNGGYRAMRERFAALPPGLFDARVEVSV
jgi:hypothetical protein